MAESEKWTEMKEFAKDDEKEDKSKKESILSDSDGAGPSFHEPGLPTTQFPPPRQEQFQNEISIGDKKTGLFDSDGAGSSFQEPELPMPQFRLSREEQYLHEFGICLCSGDGKTGLSDAGGAGDSFYETELPLPPFPLPPQEGFLHEIGIGDEKTAFLSDPDGAGAIIHEPELLTTQFPLPRQEGFLHEIGIDPTKLRRLARKMDLIVKDKISYLELQKKKKVWKEAVDFGWFFCFVGDCDSNKWLNRLQTKDERDIHLRTEHGLDDFSAGKLKLVRLRIISTSNTESPNIDISPLLELRRKWIDEMFRGSEEEKFKECFMCLINRCDFYKLLSSKDKPKKEIEKHRKALHSDARDINIFIIIFVMEPLADAGIQDYPNVDDLKISSVTKWYAATGARSDTWKKNFLSKLSFPFKKENWRTGPILKCSTCNGRLDMTTFTYSKRFPLTMCRPCQIKSDTLEDEQL